ncbi:hypothetical protein WAI453_013070 [Rhynchosporium graminicola]
MNAIARFRKKQLKDFDQKTFSDILEEASEYMGLPLLGHNREVDMESFSHNKVLKIELSGPEYEHFSVIDLPGLFRTYGRPDDEIRYGFGQADAGDADPYSQRTLRVLTKPDLVDKGAEDKILDLINNTKGKGRFELGYTIICNRS